MPSAPSVRDWSVAPKSATACAVFAPLFDQAVERWRCPMTALRHSDWLIDRRHWVDRVDKLFNLKPARLIGDTAFVGVRWPGSEHFTDIEIRRDNIIFTVRRPNGQVVRRVTVI